MPKFLKDTRKAIQSRNRVRLFRGVRAIFKEDETFMNGISFGRLSRQHFERNEQKINGSLSNSLRTWATEYFIRRRALTALLKILICFGMRHLPKDSRSLMRTPRTVEIEERAGGKYWHNGIANCLSRTFAKLSSNLMIEINISVDGLQLFKSSPIVFWPFLFNIHGS